ncbi:MAG TPA: acyltransferase [Verrucomicrobiota bacterium]|nr:acyltransferase [Verrucomicrobiota bacterium]
MSAATILSHDWFPRPLPDNVVIGARSWCYSSYAFLHYRSRRERGVRVGSDSGIYHGTFFDLGPDGEVEIGNFCTLVGSIISTNSRVTIGNYAFLAHEVVVGDSSVALPPAANGSESVANDRRQRAIVIGENSWVGARAVILSGANIGPGAIIGAAAIVDFEVPAGAIVAGNPARIVGWVNENRN